MIPKLSTSEHISLTPTLQAQILCNVANNTSLCIKSCEYDIMISQDDVVLEHDGSKIIIEYSQEWVQVMRALNNLSHDIKMLILRLLKMIPVKILLMINVITSMQHSDIIFTISTIFFGMIVCGKTYDVHTYINHNNEIELLLCYSKCCGYENNPHGLSKCLIKYFDNMYDKQGCDKLNELLLGYDKMIDPEQKIYLMSILSKVRMIIVGQQKDSEASTLMYVVNDVSLMFDLNKVGLTSKLLSTYTEFHKFIANGLDINITSIRTHHNLIDGVLC